MKTKTCIVKIESKGNMPCGRACVYVPAGEAGNRYTGWRHVDPALNAHHGAVPKGWV